MKIERIEMEDGEYRDADWEDVSDMLNEFKALLNTKSDAEAFTILVRAMELFE